MINKVILVGNVGKDPESKQVNNVTLTTLSLATSESYKDKAGNKVENTEWHNLVFWRGLADVVATWVKKGQQLYVEGKIKTEKYEKDGQTHYVTKIVCSEMQMIGSKSEQKPSALEKVKNAGVKAQEQEPEVVIDEGEDDLPF